MSSPPKKLRLAYFSPLNPVQSGISDYSEDLLPWLARYAEIDLYLDKYQPTNQKIAQQFAVYPASRFKRQIGRYDTFLFHMGNSAAHAYIYRSLQETSGQGVLVLHDYVLHHFLIGEYLNRGKALEYIRLMSRTYGAAGEATAREVIKGKLPQALFNYPLCDTAIEAARAVLVHSHYAQNLIKQSHPTKLVGLARMGVPLPEIGAKAAARARLGLTEDEFVLVSIGHLNPYKRLDSALWAFRAFSREFPNSRYILVGSPSPNYKVQAMIQALGLEAKVQVTGYADDTAYLDYLAAGDVYLNLRYPTAGETSASLLRIMGAGQPVLVSRTGAFEELPDQVCIKVDVGEAEEELLLEYLRLLASRPALRQQLGQNARQFVADLHRPAEAAHDYYLFLGQVLGRYPEIEAQAPIINRRQLSNEPALELPNRGQAANVYVKTTTKNYPTHDLALPTSPLSNELLGEVAQAMAELGFSEDDPVLEEIAQAVKFAGGN